MKPSHDVAPSSPVAAVRLDVPARWSPALFLALGAVVAGFALPLYRLFTFAADHELFSYIVLIPAVSAYWLWMDRGALKPGPAARRSWASVPLVCGVALLGLYWTLQGPSLAAPDALALTTLSFICLLGAVSLYFLSAPTLRVVAFPLGFLLFLIPFPGFLHHGIENALQHASAAMSSWIFQLIGTPVFLQGTLMQLPGFTMEVAPECSGIRSSIVLLITSVVAGKLFLRSGWNRILLVLLVAPVSILRNGVRIAVIGELCVNIGPHMIDSFIHSRGGPIFFAFSLIPLFAATLLMMRMERKRFGRTQAADPNSS
jgi:exosortase C (VPDSG-CTERM-specific)